jgi:hypothetical protein
MRKGVRGGNRVWFSIWVVIAGAQVVRKIVGIKPVIETFELKAGDTILIRDLGRPDLPERSP